MSKTVIIEKEILLKILHYANVPTILFSANIFERGEVLGNMFERGGSEKIAKFLQNCGFIENIVNGNYYLVNKIQFVEEEGNVTLPADTEYVVIGQDSLVKILRRGGAVSLEMFEYILFTLSKGSNILDSFKYQLSQCDDKRRAITFFENIGILEKGEGAEYNITNKVLVKKN